MRKNAIYFPVAFFYLLHNTQIINADRVAWWLNTWKKA